MEGLVLAAAWQHKAPAGRRGGLVEVIRAEDRGEHPRGVAERVPNRSHRAWDEAGEARYAAHRGGHHSALGVRDPGLDLAKRCSDAVCVLRDMPSKPGDAASRHVASSTDGRWQQQQQRATAVMALDVCQADPSILSVGELRFRTRCCGLLPSPTRQTYQSLYSIDAKPWIYSLYMHVYI